MFMYITRSTKLRVRVYMCSVHLSLALNWGYLCNSMQNNVLPSLNEAGPYAPVYNITTSLSQALLEKTSQLQTLAAIVGT